MSLLLLLLAAVAVGAAQPASNSSGKRWQDCPKMLILVKAIE